MFGPQKGGKPGLEGTKRADFCIFCKEIPNRKLPWGVRLFFLGFAEVGKHLNNRGDSVV